MHLHVQYAHTSVMTVLVFGSGEIIWVRDLFGILLILSTLR